MNYLTKFIKQKEIALGTRLFEFEKPVGFEFRAGQCVDMILPNPKFVDSGGAKRSFSIVSAPHEKTLSFTVRMRESAFKKSLGALAVGDEVSLEGPMGSFKLHSDVRKPAILIAGGIGITPFISILRENLIYSHLSSQRLSLWEITLFYSNRDVESFAFLDELREMASRQKRVTFVPTVTRPNKTWTGEVGRVDKKLIAKYVGKISNQIFYIAGTLSFVVAMREALLELGATDDNIRTDEFPGY